MDKIIIIDFGGQYAHLIASKIRRSGVLSEIIQPDEFSWEKFSIEKNLKGVILSGGPQSIYDENSPQVDPRILTLNIPILGICYGHQWICHQLGAKIEPSETKEYGRAELTKTNDCPLLKDIPDKSIFWMSHGDEVTDLPDNIQIAGQTDDCKNAVIFSPEKKIFGIQFHPEVTHSEYGEVLLENFITICEAEKSWTMEKFLETQTAKIKAQVGDKNVFLLVSGGVDSSVCLAFLTKVLGAEKVHGMFIDNGLLRFNEVEFVQKSLQAIGAKLTTISASEIFLGKLSGITDPEEKRRIIGDTFLEVQRTYFAEHKLGENWLLGQGTIYPDTIESGATKNSATIKTHHNRVPEITAMLEKGLIIEPIADLYKDEVRKLGELLGLPANLVWRHPFPGPGLGVRILCANKAISTTLSSIQIGKWAGKILPIKSVGVQGDGRSYRHPLLLNFSQENPDLSDLEKISTAIINRCEEVNRVILPLTNNDFKKAKVNISDVNTDRTELLQLADKIVLEELTARNLYQKIWQFPVVLLPISFDGQGQESIVLRPINSVDAMSASVGKLPWDFFTAVSQRIKNELPDISAVFLDITSKPPGTIEWE
jgi:GMP synthase (glutamine-hydrolysing)